MNEDYDPVTLETQPSSRNHKYSKHFGIICTNCAASIMPVN